MKSPAFGLFRRREIWVPTWRGTLLLLLLLAGMAATLFFGIYPFLAPQDPCSGGVLALEGWVDNEALTEARHEYEAHNYSALYVTGLPISAGLPIKDFGTYANFGAERLHAIGVHDALGVPAPAATHDRTYASARALRDWFQAHGGVPAELTVMTHGPHARRSRLLFDKAFGDETRIGVISAPPRDYDPAHWWQTSAGVRDVIGETIAYLYVRLLFWRSGE